MAKRALITGITGQSGSYLADLLVEKDYDVYGIIRRGSTITTGRIDHLFDPHKKGELIFGDLNEGIDTIIYDLRPDMIFNMASQSHVRVSFDVPVYTMNTNAVGPLRILEAIRRLDLKNKTRFYQASSSEMFGTAPPPQNENTPFHPCSPYGIAKLAAYWSVKIYRDGYGLFASNGILMNHESSRRGETFVTKKIVRGAVRIKLGKQKDLVLGNLEAKRDWGHAREYMKAVIKILEHHEPDDFVIATGKYYSIKEFLQKVFEKLDLDWEKYVKYDAKYTRPKEVPALMGDPTKAREVLGWEHSVSIDQLIDEMVDVVMEEETNGKN